MLSSFWQSRYLKFRRKKPATPTAQPQHLTHCVLRIFYVINQYKISLCPFNCCEPLKLAAPMSVHCPFFVCVFRTSHWPLKLRQNIKARNKRDFVYVYKRTHVHTHKHTHIQRLIGIFSVCLRCSRKSIPSK